MRPKVSVATVTYNHEAYIAQAIESVLMQEGDFDLEFVIGEDCSTDRTLEIVRSYESRFPDKIRVLTSAENVGPQANFTRVLEACGGAYVAVLDGDDYWTSPRKLAKQVAYLVENPGCTVCCHNTQVIFDDGRSELYLPVAHQAERSELADILSFNFIASCTVMYRWGTVPTLPPWWPDLQIGDLPLHAMHAQHGWIGYIDEVLSAYRVHGGGRWSTQEPTRQGDAMVGVLGLLDEYLGHEYHDVILDAVFASKYWTASQLTSAGRGTDAKPYVRWCLSHLRHRGAVSATRLVVLVLLVIAPVLVPLFVRIKRLLRRSLKPGP